MLGRVLTRDDERPDADPAALVGELFWQHRLGGDAAAIGQSIRVNGKLLRVVGVIPRSVKNTADVWMPLARQPYVIEGSTLLSDWNSALDVCARLRPGVSPHASEQETLALAAGLRETRPDRIHAGEHLEARPVLQLETNSNEFQIALTATGLVLLLLVAACANLGTLVLARGVTREREIRTRMALGAGRARVVRQLFTESLLLAVLSGVSGLFLSSLVLKLIQLQHNPDASVLPDWRALAATFGAALLATFVFGLLPALRLTALAPRAGRARTIFLVVQVAASCLLLVVSSLMVTNLHRLGTTDPGFDSRHLVWISPGLNAHGYGGPAARSYFDLLGDRTRALGGVTATSTVWLAPLGGIHMGSSWQGHQFAGNHVDAKFLDTMGMRLLRGRNFQPGETAVAIISEAMERTLWPDRDALGKALPWEPHGPTVIGVVRNASTTSVGNPNPLEFYQPLTNGDAPESVLLLRVAGNPHDFVRGLRGVAGALDPRLQPTVQALTDSYDQAVENVTHALAVIGLLGTVAIQLSAIGLAGLAAYTVAQRTREIGLRMALGARAAQVVRAVLAPMVRPIAIGLVCGAFGGGAAAKILRSGWFATAGLNYLDPVAYLMVAAFFSAVVALAVFGPVRRAIRINPSQALQHE